MDVQTDVGIGNTDVRTLSGFLAELVDNGILHLICYKLRMAEFLGEYDRVNGEGFVWSDVFAPVNILHAFIDIVSRQSLEVFDGFQNADGSVQLEIGTIQKFLITLKRYHTTAYLHIVCAQLRQFFR